MSSILEEERKYARTRRFWSERGKTAFDTIMQSTQVFTSVSNLYEP